MPMPLGASSPVDASNVVDRRIGLGSPGPNGCRIGLCGDGPPNSQLSSWRSHSMRAVVVVLHVSFLIATVRLYASPPRAIIPKSQNRRKRASCAPLNSSRTLHRPIWLTFTSPQAGSLIRFLSLSPNSFEFLTRTLYSLAKIPAHLALASKELQQSSASSPPSSTVAN